MSLLHPGDLGLDGWLLMLGMFLLFCVAPVVIIGFIIYKVFSGREGNN